MVAIAVIAAVLTVTACTGQTLAGHPPPPPPPFGFNISCSDDMVLQQAPAKSAVYGILGGSVPAPGANVTVTVTSAETSYTVDASIIDGGTGWIAYLKPTRAVMAGHGSPTLHTIHAECSSGCTLTDSTVTPNATISNVIFGDVYYCSGQSNMALPLLHTMSRNKSMDAVMAGQYANMRFFDLNSNMNPTTPWTTPKDAVNNSIFFTFSATCWYFGESLTDRLGDAAPPIGLVHTAWGGSTIEQWLTNDTIAECKNATISHANQEWHDSRVLPFVHTTIKGWTWYQGENDMHGVFGNSVRGVGYSCMMPKLIAEWRKLWSAVPGTTAPDAPFGLVTLAPSGSEGGNDIGSMRLAQTAGYGVVPNPAMPNTFLAQAFDLNDPWANISCYHDGCCPNNFHPKGNCDSCLGPNHYCENLTATNYYMGPIHPRDKKPVGERLAEGAAVVAYGKPGVVTGPTLSGCRVTGNTLTVKFNTTLLGGGSVKVQDYPKQFNASKFDVLLNASMFCFQTTGRGGSARCLDDGFGGPSPGQAAQGDFGKVWVPVDIVGAASDNTITVSLEKSGGVVYGIRYGMVGDCCSEYAPTANPCPVASCPLMGSSGLPANPFLAKVEQDKCKCMPPQVCDE